MAVLGGGTMCWVDMHTLTLTCVRLLQVIFTSDGAFWLYVVEIMGVV